MKNLSVDLFQILSGFVLKPKTILRTTVFFILFFIFETSSGWAESGYKILVYPNPAILYTNIEIKNINKGDTISIDLDLKEGGDSYQILSDSIAPSDSLRIRIDLQNIPNGYYNLHCRINQTTETFYILIDKTNVGLDTKALEKSPKIYPNPFSDKIFIEGSLEYNFAKITDISGKEILRVSNSNNYIQTEKLPPGQYIVVLQGSKNKESKIMLKTGNQ